ncbi:MAG: gluconokinase [Actinomycetes bacterium]
MSAAESTRHVVVMGVSGSGKTTIAQGISAVTGMPYGEADQFHPQANVDKMAAGIPLNDEDRWPWLRDIAAWMASEAADGKSTVVACSALKRSYRDLLRGGPPALQFVQLDGSAEVIRERMSHRSGHFMPTTLLDSQIATLEPLQPDEDGIVLDLTLPPEVLVDEAVRLLHLPVRQAENPSKG